MIYFLAAVAAIAGLLFGYDEGVIAVASPSLARDFPMSPLEHGFTTAAVPLGALGATAMALLTARELAAGDAAAGRQVALADVCHLIFCLNEFVYVD